MAPEPSHASPAVAELPSNSAQAPNFYRAFEDRHRGSRELIQQRLQVYLPFLRPLAALHQTLPALPVLDVGCGRGEWLELLAAEGIAAHGVDTDEGMLAACRERGLNVTRVDALQYLASLPNHSLLAVTGFHLAEHLPFDALQTLMAQALRVLTPGGLLILETPNPENLLVGASHFYLDPTHERPLPWQLLSFLAEYQGFGPVKLLRLQEEPWLAASKTVADTVGPISLYDVLGNVSPDYAIVAQAPQAATPPPAEAGAESPADQTQLKHQAQLKYQVELAEAFSRDYGVSLHALASRFDRQIQSQALALQLAQHTQSQFEQRLEQLNTDLQHYRERAEQSANQLLAMHASRSWRVTRPLRWVTRQLEKLKTPRNDG